MILNLSNEHEAVLSNGEFVSQEFDYAMAYKGAESSLTVVVESADLGGNPNPEPFDIVAKANEKARAAGYAWKSALIASWEPQPEQ